MSSTPMSMPSPAQLPTSPSHVSQDAIGTSPAGKKKKFLTEELIQWAKLDMTEELSEVLRNKPHVLNLVDEETGNTLLIWTVIEQNLGAFNMLLEQDDIDLNIQGQDGNTALLRCALVGYPIHQEMSSILLAEEDDDGKKKCDVNLRNDKDETAFTVAAKFCRYEMAKEIQAFGTDINHQVNKNQNTNLSNACFEGNLEQVKFLLEIGVDINSQNWNGDSAFNKACEQGHLEIAQILLQKGYDINTRNKNGRTALIFSIMTNKMMVTEFLVNQGANINVQDQWGFTALLFACKNKGQMKQIQYLLEKGANINKKDRNEENVLHHACRDGHFDIMTFLVTMDRNLLYARNLDNENPLSCIQDNVTMWKYAEQFEFPFVELRNTDSNDDNDDNDPEDDVAADN